MAIPPGIPFLVKGLFRLGMLSTCVLALIHTLRLLGDVVLPNWLVVSCIPGSIPLAFAVRKFLGTRREQAVATRLGAVWPPVSQGKWPGNLDRMLIVLESTRSDYPGWSYTETVRNLGAIYSYSFMWLRAYVTCDANIIKSVLATDFANWVKGDVMHEQLVSFLGNGVFNSDGDMWKFHRSMTRPFFSHDRIRHFELFDRHAETTMSCLQRRLRCGYAVDFQDLISRFTLDSATEFLFGHCVHSLRGPLPYPHHAELPEIASELKWYSDFPSAFVALQYVVSDRLRIGWTWPLKELFYNRTNKHMAVVDKVLSPILHSALRKREEGKEFKVHDIDVETDDDTLLDHLVRYTSDFSVLHDETLNILLAARDTTAATLTFTVYFLCMYPVVFQRLRKEVLDRMGLSRMPTFDDIRDMKYLRAVLNETLRLFPAVPWNTRTAVKDTTVPNPDPAGPPIFVPQGTTLAYCVLAMHRRKEYWGPDADEFDPDRFIDERVQKYLIPNPWIFLPFNGGPRVCLGQQFAYNQMSFFLIRLLQNFSAMELDLSAQPPEARPPAHWAQGEGRMPAEKIFPKMHLTMFSMGGLWVKMTETEGAY